MQIVENDLRPPAAGEVRVKVLATCVTLPDVQARYGQSPFAPKISFVPGYAIVGVVDALGEGIDQTAVGDRAAALTVYGGYAEEAAKADALLESGQVTGNIVLLTPELL